MTLPSSLRNVWLILIAMLVSNLAHSQVTNYDPEYDDEMAAGTIDNATPQAEPTDAVDAVDAADAADASPAAASSADASAAREAGAAATTDTAAASVNGLGLLAVEGGGGDEKAVAAGASVAGAGSGAKDNAAPWDWGGRRLFSGLDGATGLFHTASATSDEMGTFGLGIHGAFFTDKDYLLDNDKNTSMWAGLSLRVTPWDYLEVFAGLESRSNFNNKVEPELFQSLGDFHLGLKGFYPVIDPLALGLLVGFEFKNPVGKVNVSFKGMSFPLGLLTTLDASKLNEKLPFKAHLNLIYRFDNAGQLVEDVERRRGGCDTDVDGDGIPDYDGCLNPVERTALGIDRLDQFRIGLGLEATVPYVTPLVEYTLEIPVNRQDFSCPNDASKAYYVTCMTEAGIRGMRQWMTFGVRVLPPVKTLTVDFGVDWGLTGFAPSVHELAAQPSYRILFGLTYNFDPFPDEPAVQTVAAPCPETTPPVTQAAAKSVIVGFVHDADTGAPLLGARIVYRNKGLSAQITGADGKFVSYGLEQGEVTVDVTLDGYESASFDVTIPETGAESSAAGGAAEEIALSCPLKKRQDLSRLRIRVSSDTGDTLSGVNLSLSGPKSLQGQTDAAGEFSFEGDVGSYTVVATKAGYFEKRRTTTLTSGQTTSLEMRMSAVPKVSSVELSKERIKIKKKILFARGSNDIDAKSFGLMDEIVEILRTHPEIRHVEIQGHTDNRGSRDVNKELSQQRADAVRQYLVNDGIDPSRLSAKGYGSDRPRAPNITSSGRAKNRRVEFHIIEGD